MKLFVLVLVGLTFSSGAHAQQYQDTANERLDPGRKQLDCTFPTDNVEEHNGLAFVECGKEWLLVLNASPDQFRKGGHYRCTPFFRNDGTKMAVQYCSPVIALPSQRAEKKR